MSIKGRVCPLLINFFEVMELFRTVVKIDKSNRNICYGTPFMMLGSCFAESIGNKLKQLKFNIAVNPFGIVYHPVPAAISLQRIIDGYLYNIDELREHNGLWFSFDHHGRFSQTEADTCITQINTELQMAREHLKQSSFLFVTFGTSWGYRLKDSGKIVANCHKIDASNFERINVDVDDIFDIWAVTAEKLRLFNPALQIVFTLSPVRHLGDGACRNQLSKARLLLAIERLNTEIDSTYFPAYEIVLDELRDYRFFAEDMTHPNNTAIDYIMQRFSECYMDAETVRTLKLVEDIIKAAAHRPIHNSVESQKFAAAFLEKIAALRKQFPALNFDEEKKKFASLISAK